MRSRPLALGYHVVRDMGDSFEPTKEELEYLKSRRERDNELSQFKSVFQYILDNMVFTEDYVAKEKEGNVKKNAKGEEIHKIAHKVDTKALVELLSEVNLTKRITCDWRGILMVKEIE